jgi:Host cell surface-exposed lipoprotein
VEEEGSPVPPAGLRLPALRRNRPYEGNHVIRSIALAALAGGLVLAGLGCASTPATDTTGQAATPTNEQGQDPTETAPAKEQPKETAGQQNAHESAENYLAFAAFSRKGLIKQLAYEGYSKKDAAYAVDAVSPNWNEQAVKAAKSYLDASSFSRSGLIEQLIYEGYTQAQAEYGVSKTGL